MQWRLMLLPPGDETFTELRRRDDDRSLAVYGEGESFCTILHRPFATGGWSESVQAARIGPDTPKRIATRLREFLDDVEFPDSWTWCDRLLFDDAGRIWARRPPPIDADEARWDVFRADGRHAGVVALPAGVDVREIRDGSIYVVTKGAWDEDRVERFDVKGL